MTPTLTARLDAAARLRLDRRLDALLAVRRADRDREFRAKLKARAGITGRLDRSVLLPLLYWHLVEQPL